MNVKLMLKHFSNNHVIAGDIDEFTKVIHENSYMYIVRNSLIIPKHEFVKILETIEKQRLFNFKKANLLSDAFCISSQNFEELNNYYEDLLIELIEQATSDKENWIKYYIEELYFGKNPNGYKVTDRGIIVDLSDAGKLYDFIINR